MASIYLFLLLFSINFILKIEATHYKTLMVDKNASPGEIEAAFNERKEKNRNAKQSDKAFLDNLEKLSEAHSILSDKTKREEYDRELAKKKGKSTEGESSKTAYHKDKKSKRKTESFGGGSSHFRGGTIHNVGSTFRGNGNGGFISGDQINMGSSFGGSSKAGSQNEAETQGRTQSFGGGSHHFRGGTIHNTGTFHGNGLGGFVSGGIFNRRSSVEGSDTSDSESSYDSESEFEFGKGFPFGEAGPSFRTKFTVGKNDQYADWNRDFSSVKLSIFKEGILVESPQHYPEFVRYLNINGDIGMAIINGNNIKITEYLLKTKIFINGSNVHYAEGVTNVDGVRIKKNGDKIQITGRNINTNTNMKRYSMIKAKAIKVHVTGSVENIPTPSKKYEFKQNVPNKRVGDALKINGNIGNLEVFI
uniref:J domain-containing protein n=1 Tax=Meloidogyne enterolobii TaxID=390850 RepID=A0A6V7UEB8_MELEN|nr:unnamed protein product [Meloidogyne enterolobii]